MNYEEVEESLVSQVVEVTREMFNNPEDERAAFLIAHQRIAELEPELKDNLLTLALMQISANAMTRNERILAQNVLRTN